MSAVLASPPERPEPAPGAAPEGIPEAVTPVSPEQPPVVGQAPARERLGLAEWTVGLALLLGSITGPWLTLMLPAAVAFLAYDRRVALRAVALVVAALCVLLALAAPGGVVMVMMAAGAMVASLAAVARGREATLGALAPPVLAGAGAGLGLGFLAAPAAVAAWESMLGRGVTEGGSAALERYRDLGMDPEALAMLQELFGTVADWTVRLWPAFAALALWLGAWFGLRLLARWGRVTERVASRLGGRPFTQFAVGEPVAWLLIAGLAGLWIPVVARAAANAALVAATLFALDGLAIVWWWLDRRGAGLTIRLVGLGLAFAFALPLAAACVIVLGVADVWLQFRRRGMADRPMDERA